MDAEQVFAAAVEVLGEDAKVHRWMNRPNMAMGGEKPIDLLGTPNGRVGVLTILMRIEWGVYS
jgi:putative toxin-antitoxin system antitoxin component (TIGR02293 family)